jgi:hypothetical protein
MGVESLIQTETTDDLQLVSIKLPRDLVETMRGIRKSTGRTNTEVYSELLKEGVGKFREVSGLTKSGKRRGRPSGNGKNKEKS